MSFRNSFKLWYQHEKRLENLTLYNLEEYNNIRHDIIKKYKALNNKVKESLGNLLILTMQKPVDLK